MAELVAVIASTHHPFYYRASTSTGEDRPDFADEWVRKVEAFRETLTKARPDVLVMVGSDHFHQLWLDNMPQFLIGKAPFYDANWYNEEREFGLPRMQMKGQEDLSAYMLREAWTRASTWRSPTSCASTTRSRARSSRCARRTTCRSSPSTPTSSRRRCRGEAVRPARADDPGTGGVVAGEPAGRGHRHRPPVPRTGRPAPVRPARPDPEFDAKAVEWISSGDIEGCLSEVTLDSLHAPGNATHGFMDFMLMMGVAYEGRKADYVDTYDLFHTMEAYFTWYPNGAAK